MPALSFLAPVPAITTTHSPVLKDRVHGGVLLLEVTMNTEPTHGLRALLLVVVLSWLVVALLVRVIWYVVKA